MGKREPNFIYIRRIATEHDLTHEINIGKPALNDFFEGNLHLTFHHINDYEKKYEIDINSFCNDPRFGKEVYNLINDEGGIEIGDLFIVYKQSKQDYLAEVVKKTNAKFNFFNQLYTKPDSNERHSFIIAEDGDNENSEYTSTPSQIIYYGVPGSGKSHRIDEETKDLPDDQKMRVVFHPEYTNTDFVGQILPVQTNGGLEFPFKAGPFARILKRALKNPDKTYYLIIEEINRGNAAAIFGDLFQLLDRGSDGWSSYGIENLDINAFIRSEDDRCSEKNPQKTKKVGNIEFNENTSLRLPPNLSLLATMNTSDQNVFTLDNAFQRRWDMQLVKNECSDTNQMEATITVADQKITWKDFQQTINAVIGEKSNEGGLSSMEDKRLGCWFVKAENKEIKADTFANKVLKYLWDDAFKFYHQEIFGTEIKNFEELQKAFFEKGFDVFSENCRLKNVVSTLRQSSGTTSSTTETSDSATADSEVSETQPEPEQQ